MSSWCEVFNWMAGVLCGVKPRGDGVTSTGGDASSGGRNSANNKLPTQENDQRLSNFMKFIYKENYNVT